jgi:sugar/nucleoside kinase (ribokinase family)
VLDACEKYPAQHIASALEMKDTKNCKCFYTTGFFLEVSFESLEHIMNFTHSNNRILGFNFAAEYLYHTQKEKILKVMEYSDFIFCNKDEALTCA